MKQQEELVGSAVRVLQRFGVFWTWRLNRYNAICVIQKLYRTQIENIRLRAIQEAVRLEQLRAAAADKFAALWKGRQSRKSEIFCTRLVTGSHELSFVLEVRAGDSSCTCLPSSHGLEATVTDPGGSCGV